MNRQQWIENELINEEIATDFESNLQAFWKNKKKAIDITNTDVDVCAKGQLLYLACKNRQQTVGDKEPPARTIAGTYHSLADIPIIGWHSDWEQLKRDEK